jgi:hypothetical protein
MHEVKVAIGDGFLESFAVIPKAKQKRVMEFVAKFRHNPKSGGINYEKINDARDPNFRSVRVDQDYRGIVLSPEKGDVYVLLWVDKHDDAYDWARRHRCDIHPTTGTLQLLQVQTSIVADAAPAMASQPEQPTAPTRALPTEACDTTVDLFSLDDPTLLRFGVPPGELSRTRALNTVAHLEGAEAWLPREAFEALYLYAAGTPITELLTDFAAPPAARPVDTTDFATALDADASRQRFHAVESELELIEMLEAPLEKWRVFLHPSQRRLVERNWNGPVRVLGGAGTGKTVVAMHRARWLAQHGLKPGERILFTTFTANLATDIAENLRKICSPEAMQRIDVEHIDAWVSGFLRSQDYKLRIVYQGDPSGDYAACWQRAETLVPADLGLPSSFYTEEWERVVLPNAVKTSKDYTAVSRAGRGVSLTRKQRTQIWPVFEEMRIQLALRKLTTLEDAIHEILAMLKRDGVGSVGYRSIVVDEGQDFSGEMLTLLRHLAPHQSDDLFIVGDGHQRIYQRKAILGRCGIDIRGRGRKLRINYRTTEEIRRFAVAVLSGVKVDDLDGGSDGVEGYRSLMHGLAPERKSFDSQDQEVDWLRDAIDALQVDGMHSQDICLVARTNALVESYAAALKRLGVAVKVISRRQPDHRSTAGVRLATMHRVKGLEFRAVFMVGLNKGIVPLEMALRTKDPVEAELRSSGERALFHVAATRAVKRLFLSSFGVASEFLNP